MCVRREQEREDGAFAVPNATGYALTQHSSGEVLDL